MVATHPARGLGQNEDTEEGDYSKEDLQGKREAELGLVVDVAHAVVC
jgi:hypothetical protein